MPWNRKYILRKKCRPTLTNNPNLHKFLIITESGSLSYWIQHSKLYKWWKFHALIIFWKLLLFNSWTIRKSKDYVYGIWLYKVIGIWKGYHKVKWYLPQKRHISLTWLKIPKSEWFWNKYFRENVQALVFVQQMSFFQMNFLQHGPFGLR